MWLVIPVQLNERLVDAIVDTDVDGALYGKLQDSHCLRCYRLNIYTGIYAITQL